MSHLCKRQKCLNTHRSRHTHAKCKNKRSTEYKEQSWVQYMLWSPKATNKAALSFRGIYVTICSEEQQQQPTAISFGVKTGNMLAAHKKTPTFSLKPAEIHPERSELRRATAKTSHLPAWGSNSRSTLTAPRHMGQCHTPSKKSAKGVPHGCWSTATVPCSCHDRKALPYNGGGFSCGPTAWLTHSTKSTKSSLATRLAGQKCWQPPKAWVRNINCLINKMASEDSLLR